LAKLIILDFDGVLVKSGKMEKCWRKFSEELTLKKTPRFLLEFCDIFDFLAKPAPELKPEAKRFIRERDSKSELLALITDRSLFFISSFFSKSKEISPTDFEFIQVRESFLNQFSPWIKFIGEPKTKPQIFVSAQTKPAPEVLKNKELKRFLDERNIKQEEVLIIDDLFEMRKAAREMGFPALAPKLFFQTEP